jgi:hypothetical protein
LVVHSEPWAPYCWHLALTRVVESKIDELEDLLVELLWHVRLLNSQFKHVLWHAGLANPFPLLWVVFVQVAFEYKLRWSAREIDDLSVIREAGDLEHRIVSVEDCDPFEFISLVCLIRLSGHFVWRLG